jgi:hypothetical protein
VLRTSAAGVWETVTNDTTGASRMVHAERFTAFTQVMVWDGNRHAMGANE